MSRSNQNELFNPCTKWMDWNGGNNGGFLESYDKDKDNGPDQEPGGKIKIPIPFVFIFLDQLSTIKGWHSASKSAIWSNEIRDLKSSVMVVRSYKGGVLGNGLYAGIKDAVKLAGGKFIANIYVAIKDNKGVIVLGSLQFTGAALNAWIEFHKANKANIGKMAVSIHGFKDDKSGGIDFRVPEFKLVKLNADTDEKALAIDKDILQPYLTAYLSKIPVVTTGVSNSGGDPVKVESESRSSKVDIVVSAPVEAEDELGF